MLSMARKKRVTRRMKLTSKLTNLPGCTQGKHILITATLFLFLGGKTKFEGNLTIGTKIVPYILFGSELQAYMNFRC